MKRTASGIFRVAQNPNTARIAKKCVIRYNGISHKIKGARTSYKEQPSEGQANDIEVNESINKFDSPTSLILSLLKNMPNTTEICEVAIQPNIRTAADAHDTVNDITPKKHTCVSMPHMLTTEQQRQLDEVLAEFPYTPATGPLNKTNVHMQSINTGDALPRSRKQYPLLPYMLQEIEAEVQNLIDKDIIERIDFSPWRWPILWVRKKTGGGRIVVDARGLNEITIPDAYPTLNVDTILRNLPKARFISCLDMHKHIIKSKWHQKIENKNQFCGRPQILLYQTSHNGFQKQCS